MRGGEGVDGSDEGESGDGLEHMKVSQRKEWMTYLRTRGLAYSARLERHA